MQLRHDIITKINRLLKSIYGKALFVAWVKFYFIFEYYQDLNITPLKINMQCSFKVIGTNILYKNIFQIIKLYTNNAIYLHKEENYKYHKFVYLYN